jgi:hypothetical protein
MVEQDQMGKSVNVRQALFILRVDDNPALDIFGAGGLDWHTFTVFKRCLYCADVSYLHIAFLYDPVCFPFMM